MAATDPEAARMAAQMHAGGFPLDGTLNAFQPAAPAAILTAPPNPDSVATSVSELPAAPRLASVVKSAVPPASKPGLSLVPVAPGRKIATPSAPVPTHWADAGLLGLLSLGGWFYWRTRRGSAPLN